MRGSPEPGADLISRGQLCAVHIWRRAAPPPPPPARPGVTFQECWQRRTRIWSAFLGAAGVPSGAWPGAGGGRRPARISWLLPPLAAVRPGQARGAASTGKGGKTWPSPVVPGGAQWSGRPRGPSTRLPRCGEEGTGLERSGTLSGVMWLSPVVWPVPGQMLIPVVKLLKV